MASATVPDPIRAATEPRRLQILQLIWDDELSVSEIAAHLPVSVPAVSQHLAKLRAAGLVSVRPEGRRRFYRASQDEMGSLVGTLEAMWGADGDEDRDRSALRHGAAAPARSEAASTPTPATVAPARAAQSPSAPDVTQATRDPRARPAMPGDVHDEMSPWYRQGLRARVVALEGARKALAESVQGAEDSIRRIGLSLTRPAIAGRFPELGETARIVSAQDDVEIVEGVDRLIGAVRQTAVHDESELVKILLVEDSRVEATLHRSIIGGPNRDVLIAETAARAEEILASEDIDLIVLDLTLPGGDGRDLLIGLGRRPRTAVIPVILLTSRTDTTTRTEATALGVDGFYAKPVDRALISSAVSMTLEKAAEARELGRVDPLTGLRNRGVFVEELRQVVATAVRARLNVSFAILEVDRLGAVNDFYGSEVGDEVVRSIGLCLKRTFRDSDLLCRWEGNKFAVLFTNAGPEGATIALEKLEQVTSGAALTLPDGSELVPRWHAGVAAIRDRAGVEDAVTRATRRARLARRAGTLVASVDDVVRTGARTVLLIEDDEILADLIEHRLGREGFEIERFSDGAEALEALPRIDASAVVLDTMLPGAEGFEVLRRLKEAPAYAGVPVVVLTFGSERDAARAFRLGASDSLAKPFSVEELVARVSRLVSEFEEAPT